MTVPDFSPRVIKAYIAARIVARSKLHGETEAKAERAVSTIIRRDAGISVQAFAHARRGTLRKADLRARVWGALGCVPAEYGVLLTDNGKQTVQHNAGQGG